MDKYLKYISRFNNNLRIFHVHKDTFYHNFIIKTYTKYIYLLNLVMMQ